MEFEFHWGGENPKYDVENDGKGVTWPAFSSQEDTNADVQIGNEGENEAAATENGEVGNEGENEEDDAEFVDSDYEFNEQEDEVLVAENVVVGGPSGKPNAGENVGPNVEPTIDPNADENVGPNVQPSGLENVWPTYEAPGEVARGWTRSMVRDMGRGLARGRANIPLSQSAAPTQESSNPSSTCVTAKPGSIFKIPAIRRGTFKRAAIRGGTFKRPTQVLSQP
ncbi:hypothetical protein ACE6H2_024186 [Prunus campanulata]